jgi:sec-independent protein translocase protein TatB
MPSFPDTAVLVLLALLLFGPKKLPVLARQLGKLMADFRRASNEFRTQMEEELRISEQAERQKQVAAIEGAAPPTIASTTPTDSSDSTEDSHVPPPAPSFTSTSESSESTPGYPEGYSYDSPVDAPADATAESAPAPLPIATSGELTIQPPATGLPIPNSAPTDPDITEAPLQPHQAELETETLHG